MYKGILIIGDIHFQEKAYLECENLIKRIFNIVAETNPSTIILLGDVLDTHERVKQPQWEQMCRFVETLSSTVPVYILVGNHDYINGDQFLTDKHFYNPFKKWENVCIIDHPKMVCIEDSYQESEELLVMCPYVPKGRIIEALDTLHTEVDNTTKTIMIPHWTDARVLFCHSEFHGVTYKGRISSDGDEWSDEFPVVISGHIHNECYIEPNIMYVGSCRQVNADECPDKFIWHLLFPSENLSDDEVEGYTLINNLWIKKIPLGLRTIKEIKIKYDEISEFDFSLLEENNIKLHIECTDSEFKSFKKTQLCKKMVSEGVLIQRSFIDDSVSSSKVLGIKIDGIHNFEKILEEVVSTKSDAVKEIYSEFF